jgi:hypothetical protein
MISLQTPLEGKAGNYRIAKSPEVGAMSVSNALGATIMQALSRSGGTGRRAGFKIRFPLKECGFDSLLRHCGLINHR